MLVTRGGAGGPLPAAVGDCGSTNTDTDASPSLKTRWVTDFWLSPNIWVELLMSRNPGGNSAASQVASAAWLTAAPVAAVCRNSRYWRVAAAGCRAASAMCAGSVSSVNTSCSTTLPRTVWDSVLSGMALASSIHTR